MGQDDPFGLLELAAAVARARVVGLVDVFLERRADAWWHLAGGRVASREVLLREGAAVRRNGTLVSADSLERSSLARLLGITTRRLPRIAAPAFAEPPAIEAALPPLPGSWAGLHWSWRWAAVLVGRRAVPVHTPQLAEVTLHDGHRSLTAWPPPIEGEPAERLPSISHRPRAGRPCLLLTPAASAVLLHEMAGHPLEADMMRGGASPRHCQPGERLFDLPLSLADDPTRTDLPGSFSADDEGEAAHVRQLVTDGVVADVLADREGAAALGIAAGNARRATVHSRPRPRISNLIARTPDPLPAPPRREAAIEIETLASGALEPASGAILLRVRTAYALRRGERSRSLAPFTVVGSLAAVRSGVLAVAGDAVATSEPGWCAKDGEVVPTGAVAPWLLVAGLEVR